MPNQKAVHLTAMRFRGDKCIAKTRLTEFRTRRGLVQFVNQEIDKAGMSRRTRRQVDLAMIWRTAQRSADTLAPYSFTITDNADPTHRVEFRAMPRTAAKAKPRTQWTE